MRGCVLIDAPHLDSFILEWILVVLIQLLSRLPPFWGGEAPACRPAPLVLLLPSEGKLWWFWWCVCMDLDDLDAGSVCCWVCLLLLVLGGRPALSLCGSLVARGRTVARGEYSSVVVVP